MGTGVTDIQDNAFSSCSSLTGVYFRGDAPSLAHCTFDDDDNSGLAAASEAASLRGLLRTAATSSTSRYISAHFCAFFPCVSATF